MKKSILSFMENAIFDYLSADEVEMLCFAKAEPILSDTEVSLECVETETMASTIEERNCVEEEGEVNYLCREERILTLAKEKLKKLESCYALSDFEELLLSYIHDDSKKSLYKDLGNAFRNILKNADDSTLVELSAYLSIPGKYHLLVEEVEDEDEKSYAYGYISQTYCRTRPSLFRITFYEVGYLPIVVYGSYLKSNTARGKRGLIWRGSYGVRTHCDLGLFLTNILTFKIGLEQLMRSSNELLIQSAVKKISKPDELFALLNGKECYNKELYNNQIVLSAEIMSNPFLRDRVESFLKTLPFVEVVDMAARDYRKMEALHTEGIVKKIPFLFTKSNLYTFMDNSGIYFPNALWDLCYIHNYLSEHTWGYFPLIHWWDLPEIFKTALSDFLHKKEEVRVYIKEIRNTSSSYAKSYDTKKNIPKKIEKEMQQSILNKYFGFVEFDELCDIEKVRELAKECIALLDNFFSFIKKDTVNNSIRFRRLGKHRATGLYYPGLQCLCVDVGNPDAFVHELGHLIDYTEQFSLKNDFSDIKRMYCNHIDGLSEEVTKTFTKKYGASYYKNPTEIYARSFELYVKERLGVSNSLVKTEYGAVYPDNALFLEKVFKYFDALFASLRNNNEGGVADEREDICANIG